jgi:hypothetical protein
MAEFREACRRVDCTALVYVDFEDELEGWMHVPGSALRPGVDPGGLTDLDDVGPAELLYDVDWDGGDGLTINAYAVDGAAGSGVLVLFQSHAALHMAGDLVP